MLKRKHLNLKFFDLKNRLNEIGIERKIHWFGLSLVNEYNTSVLSKIWWKLPVQTV